MISRCQMMLEKFSKLPCHRAPESILTYSWENFSGHMIIPITASLDTVWIDHPGPIGILRSFEGALTPPHCNLMDAVPELRDRLKFAEISF
ncbi:hypothetical protein Hypma_002141 [Hypsizygus marmoreus]|uniref:Uncharacterized protein n=1 Tax=Hypsizygus marmoreus TaxID=39966 RepID=A0A369K803_HYPMA|nr:hypothetical protein Hypma_002141 [Hypsizygus marmoreus]